ncbi:hypothetical protein PMAYCL1PPCAC_26320, partial [Pristionchus mayeri]
LHRLMHPSQRKLYCRKCQGHGQKVLRKSHAMRCPYVDCKCVLCTSVMTMREKANIRARVCYRKRSGEYVTSPPKYQKQEMLKSPILDETNFVNLPELLTTVCPEVRELGTPPVTESNIALLDSDDIRVSHSLTSSEGEEILVESAQSAHITEASDSPVLLTPFLLPSLPQKPQLPVVHLPQSQQRPKQLLAPKHHLSLLLEQPHQLQSILLQQPPEHLSLLQQIVQMQVQQLHLLQLAILQQSINMLLQ